MNKYRGSSLIKAGFIGVVLIILVIAVGLQPERLISWATSLRYQALFTEGGGLVVGNDVTVAGIKVGSVSSVGLDNGDALVGFTIDGKYALGSDTTAHIRTGTLLGERVLALESEGSGTLTPGQVIPTSRTSSPYSLTEAVSELTANTADTETDTLNQSLDTSGRDARPGRSAVGADVRRPVAGFEVAQRPQRQLGRVAENRGRRDRDLVRTQPAGQRVDSQRQRPPRRAQ